MKRTAPPKAAAAAKKPASLATKLLRAAKLAGFTDPAPPTSSVEFMLRGQKMADIAAHLCRHVKPTDMIRRIRTELNEMEADAKATPERERLAARRSELQQHVDQTAAAIQQLQTELHAALGGFRQEDQSSSRQEADVVEHAAKRLLLADLSRDLQDFAQAVGDCAGLVQASVPLAVIEDAVSVHIGSPARETKRLQTPLSRGSAPKSALKPPAGTVSAPSDAASLLLDSLRREADHAAGEVYTQTAEERSDHTDDRTDGDAAGDSSALTSLLHRLRQEHLDRFAQTRRAQAEAAELRAVVDSALREHKDADREALRAQLSWVHADVAVDTLEARLDQLRKEHGSRRALLQVLADKHAEITKFDVSSADREGVIEQLARSNKVARVEISRQRAATDRLARTECPDACSAVRHLVAECSAASRDEAQTVHGGRLPAVASSELAPFHGSGPIPAALLSIQSSGDSAADRALQLLEFPAGRGLDSAVEFVLERHRQAVELDETVAAEEADVSKATQRQRQAQHAAGDLLQRVAEAEHAQRQSWLPALTQTARDVDDALALVERLHLDVTEWRDQPAQLLVPSVTHEGLSAPQWLERLRDLQARLRQLNEAQQQQQQHAGGGSGGAGSARQ